MRAPKSVALIALLVALPSALAAPDLTATTLDVLGDAQVRADLQAVFLVAGAAPPKWEATASAVVIERNYLDFVRVPGLLKAAPPHDDKWKRETLTLADATLVSGASREGGALLARGAGDVLAGTGDRFTIGEATDPRLDQGPPPDVKAGNGKGNPMKIHEVLEGEYIVTRLASGLIEIRGDVTLEVRDLDYASLEAAGTREHRTGSYATQEFVAAQTVRDEYHTITLTGAVLRIEPDDPAEIYSKTAELSTSGELLADGTAATGLLEAGRATLGLRAEGGRLTAHRPDPIATAATTAAPIGGLALPISIAVAIAIVAAGLVLYARRPRADDVEAAVLAMAQGRYAAALPLIDRQLRSRPADAKLLLDRALCLEMLGRLGAAARAYEATLRRAPRNAEAHFYLARTLAKQDNREPGLVHLQTALEIDPRLAEMARGDASFRALGVSR